MHHRGRGLGHSTSVVSGIPDGVCETRIVAFSFSAKKRRQANRESPQARAFSEADLQFLEIFSRDVAVALNTLELLVAQKANATPIPFHPGAMQTQAGVQFIETGINTDVDIGEGQKVVVGKANMDGSDRASIVVLTAKVVE